MPTAGQQLKRAWRSYRRGGGTGSLKSYAGSQGGDAALRWRENKAKSDTGRRMRAYLWRLVPQ